MQLIISIILQQPVKAEDLMAQYHSAAYKEALVFNRQSSW